MSDYRNLHDYGADLKQVRDSILSDYRRDARSVQVMDVIVLVVLFYLCREWSFGDRVALIAAVPLALGALRTFIDNFNRSWWLRRIDWELQAQGEREEAERDREVQRGDGYGR